MTDTIALDMDDLRAVAAYAAQSAAAVLAIFTQAARGDRCGTGICCGWPSRQGIA